MIRCGWCGNPTAGDPCSACGHEDPVRPWYQRGQEPPKVAKADEARKRLAAARHAIESEGRKATVDALAEQLGVDPRTVRRWREMTA